MSAVARDMVRGACPGALSPMESGDGLIVRVKPRGGALTRAALSGIARAAQAYGNGNIDLTRRANLQIRGVSEAALPALQAAIGALGLLDASAEAEAVRNIVVSPLSGVDPDEVLDMRPLAAALENAIATDAGLWRLPAKFGFVLDGGGSQTLAGVRADIRLLAVKRDSRVRVTLGLDCPDGVFWLGCTSPEDAPVAATRMAKSYLAMRWPGTRSRLSGVHDEVIAAIARSLGQQLDPVIGLDDLRQSAPVLGVLARGGQTYAAGIAAPFGRIGSEMLIDLADAVEAAGAEEVRLAPWRAFYIQVGESRLARFLEAARALGFVTEANDPVLRIESCPGAPACRSAALDTRAAARAVAGLMSRLSGVRRVHVSGCAKGCACSTAADLVLVGHGDRFGIVRGGRADEAPESFISPREINGLPELLAGRRAP